MSKVFSYLVWFITPNVATLFGPLQSHHLFLNEQITRSDDQRNLCYLDEGFHLFLKDPLFSKWSKHLFPLLFHKLSFRILAFCCQIIWNQNYNFFGLRAMFLDDSHRIMFRLGRCQDKCFHATVLSLECFIIVCSI